MKKILCILCMALSLCACDKQNENPTNKPVVKIGASFPLTGNMAAVGNAGHKALRAAINDANKKQDNKYYYDLMVENDQMDPKTINNIANKFIYTDKVNVIISFFSGAGRIVAPMAAKNQTINFNFSFDDVVLQSKYNFQNFITGPDENAATIEFLKSRSVKNVDLVYENIGAADQLLTPLLANLDAAKIKYTVHRFNKGEVDFRVLVSKLKNSESGAVFIYSYEPELDILTREIRNQNVNKIIAYSDALPMAKDFALYEGFYNIGAFITPEELKTQWGLAGQGASSSAYLYDIGSLIVEAYENTETENNIPTADEVSAQLLSKTDYSGVVGKYTLDSRGQFHSDVVTSIVKDGALQAIK